MAIYPFSWLTTTNRSARYWGGRFEIEVTTFVSPATTTKPYPVSWQAPHDLQWSIFDCLDALASIFQTIRRIHPPTIVVVLTGERSATWVAEAINRGAASYLTRPADVDEIIAALNKGQTQQE